MSQEMPRMAPHAHCPPVSMPVPGRPAAQWPPSPQPRPAEPIEVLGLHKSSVQKALEGADLGMQSGRSFIALLEAFRPTGGTAPGEIVGRLLEEHQVGNAVSLAKLIYSGRAFGFEWRHSLWIPMFQFDANDLVLKAGAQGVRAELPALWSGWHIATWFAAPNGRLDGQCPADQLDSNLDAVARAARSLEWTDDLGVPRARRAHEVAEHA